MADFIDRKKESVVSGLRRRQAYSDKRVITNVHYTEVKPHDKPDHGKVTQEKLDEILDKISASGYDSLTDDEKKILFNASKKLN